LSNLKQKSIDGVIWTLIEKVGKQFIKIILGVILARLLTPADYGLIGMITVFFAFSMVFIDSGFGSAYIQKKEANDVDASTIFYFNLFVSSLFFVALWFTAPLIADFYGESQLIELIRVMAIVLIINSFGLVQLVKLKKDVNFKKKTLLTLSSAVLATTAGIIAALLDYGVWSLVIQEIVRAIIKNLGLWIFYKWRPLLSFNIDSLKSLFSFSSWSLLIGIVNSIFDNIYTLVIGKFFPVAQLGFYTKANQFQKMISKQASNAVGSVAFPVFSKLQDEKVLLKNAVRKFNQHAMFFIAPIAAIFFVIAKPFFLILLTEKWLPMVPYFQLLLIAGVLYPLHMVNVQVLSAQGKMKLSFNISMIKNIFRVLNIIIMYRFGIINIIYGEIVCSFLALLINTFYTKRFVDYGMFEQLKDISVILLTSIVLTGIGILLMDEVANQYLQIVVIIFMIGSLYLISMYYLNRKLFLDNLDIVKNKISKNKKQ
jgi:O-antigen/teichoic acid export membrane protein